ncbi:MAG: DUF2235 domain-containing protein [Pseudomonadota bacterium]
MKNIVICLDGTGNQIEENISNVLKLYRCIHKDDTQVAYYDQGIGTLGRSDTWGRWKQALRNAVLGMGFGLGLDDIVVNAYRFLVTHYEDGDQIFLFGFSRGAYAARVLAAMLYEVGLIDPDQIHLSRAALLAYKQSHVPSDVTSNAQSDDEYEGEGANFRRVMGTRTVAIEFLGLWDTVSSVLVPNYKGIFWPPIVRETLPHTDRNPGVARCRHAIAIDERRRMFRSQHWDADQTFKPNWHASGTPLPQDALEVWFAGSHSDIGGGYPKDDSGLSQFPLIWMIEQAGASGLRVRQRMARYVSGQAPYTSTTKYLYPKPDSRAKAHESLTGLWWLLEWLPKRRSMRESAPSRSLLGYYLPRGERRRIREEARIHDSVHERLNAGVGYKPDNLPAG